MARTARIAVVTDDAAHLVAQGYLVNHLIARWRLDGFQVVVSDGVGGWPAADLAVLHVDRTRVPDSFQGLRDRYPVVVNLGGTDISKRVVSRNLLTFNDGYDGAVIVKTDANAGGHRERSLGYRTPVLGLARRVRDRFGAWESTGVLSTLKYPVYASMSDVPPAVWRNPALVVERFTPERRGADFAIRQWVFLGSREYARVGFGPQPIVKAANVTSSEVLDEIPECLRAMRADLGIDYGKFDFVVHEDDIVLLDANRTPTGGVQGGGAAVDLVSHLSEGIGDFLA
jgi:hypothetical protein